MPSSNPSPPARPKTLHIQRLLRYIIMKLALMAVLALWVLLPLFFKLESYSF